MFGWEFPPHISGGLGTACYGLTKGLKTFEDIEIIFVVPKLYGDEDQNVGNLIGAGDVVVKQTFINYKEFLSKTQEDLIKTNFESTETLYTEKQSQIFKDISFIEVKSLLQPYLSEEEFEIFLKERNLDKTNIKIDRKGKLYYIKDGIKEEIHLNYQIEKTVDEHGRFIFSGSYGVNLMQEVYNYAKVAAVIAEHNDFDIIHAHDWLTYKAGIAAKEISGKPLVIHVHATEFDRGGEFNINSNVYAIEKEGMEKADGIITVSNLTRNIVINRYGINPSKIRTVYNAVEVQPGEEKTFTKTVDEKIVTFLGRITYQKGPEYFVRAAAKVLKHVRDVRFVMAGSGDLLRKMIEYTAKLKISDRFHFTDFLKGEDVTHMFAISDVYVMPSISEPFGISPLEAMRSNVPVIISKQSGVSEVIKNAVKINYWDEDAMADAIYALVKYKGLSKMFRQESKIEVEQLIWEKPASEVRQVYLDTLAGILK